jgi:hypothetical protein
MQIQDLHNGEHRVLLLPGLKRIQETLYLKPLNEKKPLQQLVQELAVRFFAGYDLSSIDLNSDSLVSEAYEKGVTMGADLLHNGNKIPEFIVWAKKIKMVHLFKEFKLLKDGLIQIVEDQKRRYTMLHVLMEMKLIHNK